MGSHSDPSPALRAANERLLALRAQLAQQQSARTEAARRRPLAEQPVQPAVDQPTATPAPPHPDHTRAQVETATSTSSVEDVSSQATTVPPSPDRASDQPADPPMLPAHLGWDSPAVTAAVRARQVASAVNGSEETAGIECPDQLDTGSVGVTVSPTSVPPDPTGPTNHVSLPSVISLHPSLALALLRQQQVAVGRLWLLLRLLDSEGRGWLNRADIEAAFADPDSPTHFCTPRYLRQLLAEGDGFFWEREDSEACLEYLDKHGTGPAERTCLEYLDKLGTGLAERKVWLRSQAKVAAALGVTKLRGRAVELPLSVLLGPIGDLRAHLYASFHSSRRSYSDGRSHTDSLGHTDGCGHSSHTDEANPISRAALRELSGASPRTQRSYEARAKVEVQPCLAIGGLASVTDTQEAAWQQGRAAFTFIDHQGKQGAAGGRYQAHRLPNRYIGPHRRLTGRLKRLNRQLIDLCHKGYAGNGQLESEMGAAERRYYADGVAAGRVWLRQQGRVLVYWQANSGMANGRWAGSRQANNRQPAVCFWYMLGTGAV